MSFHIRFFSLISKNRVVKSVTEKDANLIILRLTPLAVTLTAFLKFGINTVWQRKHFIRYHQFVVLYCWLRPLP